MCILTPLALSAPDNVLGHDLQFPFNNSNVDLIFLHEVILRLDRRRPPWEVPYGTREHESLGLSGDIAEIAILVHHTTDHIVS